MDEKVTISCWKPSCPGIARPAPEALKKKDGRTQLHFTCQYGHTFHTDVTLTEISPCDCDPKTRWSNR
jgi:hypothetical protein